MRPMWGALLFMSWCAGAVSAQAADLTTLTLYGDDQDGKSPYSRPVRDAAGVLYTTAYAGGANGVGNVFSLTPPTEPGASWTKTVIYTFRGGSDGANPLGNLMFRRGVLYGTTYHGGGSTNCAGGCGTVFKLNRPATAGGTWKEAVLYRFGTGLYYPEVGLVADGAGALYGVAIAGYPNYHQVYKLIPPASGRGAWTTQEVFTWTRAGNFEVPNSGLLIDAAGTLYGATYQGGTQREGSVYSLVPPASAGDAWTMRVLYSFMGGSDGSRPSGLSSDGAGNLYGVTTWLGPNGAGTVYRLTPPAAAGGTWSKQMLYDFPLDSHRGRVNGGQPLGELAVRANGKMVYGMTTKEGDGFGTVFKLTAPSTPGAAWSGRTLWKFQGGADGGNTYNGISMSHTFGGMILDPAGGAIGSTSDSIDNDYPNTGYGNVFRVVP